MHLRNSHTILVKFTSNFTASKNSICITIYVFIIAQHPSANKKKHNLYFIYFFDIRTYWIHKQMKTFAHHPRVNQFILFTTQFNVPWTRWSNTGLFAYLANRQDKGPYTGTKPSDPRHLTYDFLRDKKEKNWMCWGSSFWQDSQWKKVMEFVFDWV